MQSRQITIGFDKAVNVEKIVRILLAHFVSVEVGKGIEINGIPPDKIYVHNKGGNSLVNK